MSAPDNSAAAGTGAGTASGTGVSISTLPPPSRVRLSHVTRYHYRAPVHLNPHRLMMRPRESRELQLLSHQITATPAASLAWSYDVAGNSVTMASFGAPTDSLEIISNSELELSANPWPIFDIAVSAQSYPFFYSNDERIDLGTLAIQQYLDPMGRLQKWARSFVRGAATDTLELLKAISNGVSGSLAYEVREEEGTQTPTQTLDRGMGSCRDYAVLFAEAVRSLDMGARIVSGYLYDPHQNATGSSGRGSTHAWAEVFVPGAGWITFDPTNRSVGGFNLIPVAVARDISLAMPVSGSYAGSADAFVGMEVEVKVESHPSP